MPLTSKWPTPSLSLIDTTHISMTDTTHLSLNDATLTSLTKSRLPLLDRYHSPLPDRLLSFSVSPSAWFTVTVPDKNSLYVFADETGRKKIVSLRMPEGSHNFLWCISDNWNFFIFCFLYVIRILEINVTIRAVVWLIINISYPNIWNIVESDVKHYKPNQT